MYNSEIEHNAEAKKKVVPRKEAGHDPFSFPERPENLFCSNLGNEVNDDVLSKAFSRFPTFNMAKVVRDKQTGKTVGYGFVSFSKPSDLDAAFEEMNGKYVGNQPIKLHKQERTDHEALESHKNQSHKKLKQVRKST